VWTPIANIPVGHGYAAGFTLKGMGYIACGGYPTPDNELWQYNPDSNKWTSKANFPGVKRIDIAAFTLCDYAYVGIGGEAPYYGDFYRYDPVANNWTAVADFPGHHRDDPAFFAIGDKGYVGLGQYAEDTMQ